MRYFFKSRFFKVIICIICVLLVLTGITAAVGYGMSPQTNIIGAITTPIQKLTGEISNGVSDFFTAVNRSKVLEEENNSLREQLRSMREKLIDYDDYKKDNEFYSQFLELKESNPDFKFAPATLVARDTADVYSSFTLDRGTSDGIAVHDPVITADGLVGYISQSGLTYSTVITILDPALSVGAIDSRTRESGVVSGDAQTVLSSRCKLSYLSRTSSVTLGDYIVSSGAGGVFPKGLVIGTVTEISKENANVSLYAEIEPAVNFEKITQVMVITSFDGQGALE